MDLNYPTSLIDPLRDDLEAAARRVGLALADLELLGQDPATAMAFTCAVAAGEHAAFLDSVDWERLDACRTGRRFHTVPAVSVTAPARREPA